MDTEGFKHVGCSFCDPMAGWELGCLCSPSQQRLVLHIHRWPGKRSKFKIQNTVSTKYVSLSFHREVQKFKSNYHKSGIISIQCYSVHLYQGAVCLPHAASVWIWTWGDTFLVTTCYFLCQEKSNNELILSVHSFFSWNLRGIYHDTLPISMP